MICGSPAMLQGDLGHVSTVSGFRFRRTSAKPAITSSNALSSSSRAKPKPAAFARPCRWLYAEWPAGRLSARIQRAVLLIWLTASTQPWLRIITDLWGLSFSLFDHLTRAARAWLIERRPACRRPALTFAELHAEMLAGGAWHQRSAAGTVATGMRRQQPASTWPSPPMPAVPGSSPCRPASGKNRRRHRHLPADTAR